MAINVGSVVAGDGCDHLVGQPAPSTAPRYKPMSAAAGLILTKAQAEGVYRAMCEINNVGERLDKITLASGELYVRENEAGQVIVESLEDGVETHFNQSEFATAYGLQQG